MGTYADRCRTVFADELQLIRKPELRDFVVEIFDAFGHEDFFVRPASRSGKYHPKVNLGDAGLLRHTKLAVWAGERVSRMTGSGIDSDLGPFFDQIIAALIPHDLMKDGDRSRASEPRRQGKDGWRWITGCHGVDLCEAIHVRLLNRAQPTRDQLLVMCGIAGHMGVWTLPEQYQPEKFQDPEVRTVARLVHLADYMAAQKFDDQYERLLKLHPIAAKKSEKAAGKAQPAADPAAPAPASPPSPTTSPDGLPNITGVPVAGDT